MTNTSSPIDLKAMIERLRVLLEYLEQQLNQCEDKLRQKTELLLAIKQYQEKQKQIESSMMRSGIGLTESAWAFEAQPNRAMYRAGIGPLGASAVRMAKRTQVPEPGPE